ncbi:hypothetical protein Tco_1202367 [Tanacetum coccineum]
MWHTSVSIVKDPIPYDDRVNIELLNILDHHRTIIRRSPKIFLCLIGLSRSFNDIHVHLTLLKDDESGGLHLFHVKTGERTLAEGEIPLNNETVNMTVAPSTEIIQIVEHTIIDELCEHVDKKKKRKGAGSSSVLHPTKELISSSVTPTPKTDIPEDSGSTQDAAVQTRHASSRFVVSSSSEHDGAGAPPRTEPHVRVENVVADSAGGVGTSFVPGNNAETSTSAPDADSPIDEFFNSQTVDTATAKNVYVPEWNKKFTDSSMVVQQRDAEIATLKTKLEKAESEVVEVVVLYGHVSELEAEAMARSREVDTLNKQNAELLGKVSALESESGELNGHIIRLGVDCESLQNEVAGEAKLREDFKSFHGKQHNRTKQIERTQLPQR